MITDPLFYLVVIPAVTFLGLGKGGFAGVGMVSTPLLALYMPPLQAAALLLPILFVQDAISVWTYRHHWDPWNVKVMLTGAVLGVAIAWALASYVADAAVRLLVGAIGVVFVLNAWFGGRPITAKRPPAAAGVFWGAAAGFTSALAQAGAPPFQVFVLPQQLPKFTLVGTNVVLFAAINVLKLGPYIALGQFSTKGLDHVGGADPPRRRHEFSGHLAGADNADADVLSDCLCAGVSDLIGADLAGHGRLLAGMSRPDGRPKALTAGLESVLYLF